MKNLPKWGRIVPACHKYYEGRKGGRGHCALPDKETEEHELKANIDRAIALMPIKYRMVLLLRALEGLSVKETAVTQG